MVSTYLSNLCVLQTEVPHLDITWPNITDSSSLSKSTEVLVVTRETSGCCDFHAGNGELWCLNGKFMVFTAMVTSCDLMVI